MPYSSTQRPNNWNAAGGIAAGYCSKVPWSLTVDCRSPCEALWDRKLSKWEPVCVIPKVANSPTRGMGQNLTALSQTPHSLHPGCFEKPWTWWRAKILNFTSCLLLPDAWKCYFWLAICSWHEAEWCHILTMLDCPSKHLADQWSHQPMANYVKVGFNRIINPKQGTTSINNISKRQDLFKD